METPDFQAALTPDPEPDFAAATAPKRIGRPPKAKPPPKTAPSDSNIYNNKEGNMDIELISVFDKDDKQINDIKLKDKLTQQEVNFLEIYFNSPRKKGEDAITMDKAMILAGYTNYKSAWRSILARRILKKYERTTPEAAKVFQDLGFGKVKVAQGIIRHAEGAASESVSLQALVFAGKCQGMAEQKDQGGTGINIIINTGPGPSPPGPGPGAPPVRVVVEGQEVEATTIPRKPLQITR